MRAGRADLRPTGGGRTEGRTDGRMEIPPCVLQDIGPLGPLPKKEFALAYRPQTQGQCERKNRTVKAEIAKRCHQFGPDWPKMLKWIEFSYNTTKHPSTGYSPFVLMFGREPRLPVEQDVPHINTKGWTTSMKTFFSDFLDRIHQMRLDANKNQENYNAKMRALNKNPLQPLEPGDQVLRTIPTKLVAKNELLRDGPWTVVEERQKDGKPLPVYIVRDEQGNTLFSHRNNLFPFQEPLVQPCQKAEAPAEKPVEAGSVKPKPKTSPEGPATRTRSKTTFMLSLVKRRTVAAPVEVLHPPNQPPQQPPGDGNEGGGDDSDDGGNDGDGGGNGDDGGRNDSDEGGNEDEDSDRNGQNDNGSDENGSESGSGGGTDTRPPNDDNDDDGSEDDNDDDDQSEGGDVDGARGGIPSSSEEESESDNTLNEDTLLREENRTVDRFNDARHLTTPEFSSADSTMVSGNPIQMRDDDLESENDGYVTGDEEANISALPPRPPPLLQRRREPDVADPLGVQILPEEALARELEGGGQRLAEYRRLSSSDALAGPSGLADVSVTADDDDPLFASGASASSGRVVEMVVNRAGVRTSVVRSSRASRNQQ